VVLAPTGEVIATGRVEHSPSGKYVLPIVNVLPEYHGRGIETALLHLLEEQARQERTAHSPELFLAQVSGRNTAAQKILEQSEYSLHSVFQIMELTMQEAPPAPASLEGIAIHHFRIGQDEQAVYEADEEAFIDERGKTPRTFEVWSRRLGMNTPHFDPTLWYVAWDDEQIAGTSMSEIADGRGELHHLGVRRPWRRRGLGMALLLRTLGECYRRGIHTVRLNVDGQSLTNAHLLYARAGFQVINSYRNYEKRLPPE
jgi:ribosomal protein S18 acetylase RimI-like enzyme